MDHSESKKQTVYIIDDDKAVREGLSNLMESLGIEYNFFENAKDFLEFWNDELAGCILLDIRMPEMSGLELQEELKKRQSILPVIIITAHGDVPMAVRAMHAGAMDFIEKPFREQTVLDAVNAALLKEAELRKSRRQKREFEKLHSSLTDREREVMALLVQGQSNRDIGKTLNLSPKTSDYHRQRVLHKMNVNTVVDLVRMFLKATSED